MKYIIGIDVGSGSSRAGVFSLDGNSLGFESIPIKLRKIDENFVEQSSNDIWNSVCQSVKKVISKSKINADDVIAIGFDATCSLVALDKDDNPVSVNKDCLDDWNIIMWMDHRAIKEADEINSKKFDVLKYVGGKISVEMEIPKILWLKRNLPENYKRVKQFFDLADFLQYKACGSNIRSSCTVACKWTYLAHENKWDEKFFKSLDLYDLIEENKIGNIIKEPGIFAGNLTEESSKELGLSTNVKVAVGMIDAHAGGLGSLIGKAENTLVIVAGTSACHMMNSKEAIFVNGVWGPYYNAMVSGMWLNEGGQSAYGSLIDYNIKKHPYFYNLIKEGKTFKDIYKILNDEVYKLKNINKFYIKDIHILDYHYGNRSPIADPKERGIEIGLDMSEDIISMAKLYWATIDSICFGTRNIIETSKNNGYTIDTIIVCGGAAKNPLFMRELADICQCKIYTAGHEESVVFGSAILASIASGEYKNYEEALSKISKKGECIEADKTMKEYFDKKYQIYLELYKDKLKYEKLMSDF
ncbi:putative carbohydrate kinase [Brachyspira intermedia PWS/A]|uniref:Putative carbohydrate kinase n=1 Tax=Brachyspira intermedia (strain ATCC 51140 / PWS/A) TaxID=1045858 RepID=G0EJN7_BRAIP|nr:FGGY-family carbohydrate kinase [Brachyspira intermedia]AEM22433.1 putative carbohydrate kinase [Brachyspira intermedia PWS/A]